MLERRMDEKIAGPDPDRFPPGKHAARLWHASTSVVVSTAHRPKGPGVVDITRGPFAISRDMRAWVREQRAEADEVRARLPAYLAEVATIRPELVEHIRHNMLEKAERIEHGIYTDLVPDYITTMERSYEDNRAQWDALLSMGHVVLTCRKCVAPLRCHRGILSGILVAIGATAGDLA